MEMISMDHGEALTTKASERYLLDEMSEPERFEFESHYFVCEECAEDVRVGVNLARGVRAVCAAQVKPQAESKRSWLGWLSPAWLSPAVMAPSAAAVALAVVASYQGMVVIPSMRETVAPQAMEPVVLRAVARGEEPVVSVTRKGGVSVLAMDVNAGEPGQQIAYELLPPAGLAKIEGSTRVPRAGSQLLLVLANQTLQHTGSWTLILRTPHGGEYGRYPFRIENQ